MKPISVLARPRTGKTPLPKCTVHSLACKFLTDSEANVAQFFQPYVRPNQDGDLTNSFRGRPWCGRAVGVGADCVGVVFSDCTEADGDGERCFEPQKTFREITYWKWGKQPSDDDGLVKAIEYLNVAGAVHEPITS